MSEKRSPIRKINVSEKQFQSSIIRLAKACGWYCYHTYDSRRCEPGFPDLVLIGHGKVLYRELKTETGKLTKPQKYCGNLLKAAGADYAVWRPSDWNSIVKLLTKR